MKCEEPFSMVRQHQDTPLPGPVWSSQWSWTESFTSFVSHLPVNMPYTSTPAGAVHYRREDQPPLSLLLSYLTLCHLHQALFVSWVSWWPDTLESPLVSIVLLLTLIGSWELTEQTILLTLLNAIKTFDGEIGCYHYKVMTHHRNGLHP